MDTHPTPNTSTDSQPDAERSEGPSLPSTRTGRWIVPAGVAATAIAIICCAGPGLLLAGTLTGVGGLLASPILVSAGLIATISTLAVTIHRRRRGRDASRAS